MKNTTPTAEPRRTRAEEQRRLNDLRVHGELSQEEWREKTDELSDLARWTAEGKVLK